MTLEEHSERHWERQNRRFARQEGQRGQARVPWGVRLGIVLYGLSVALIALAPAEWVSESVWAGLLVGCVAWELVGVFSERSWRQEPLTRIYRDRLMRLERWGYLFRVAFLFLFSWWMVHWIVPGW